MAHIDFHLLTDLLLDQSFQLLYMILPADHARRQGIRQYNEQAVIPAQA